MENSRTRDMRANLHGGENAGRQKYLEREGEFTKRKRKKSCKDTGDNDNEF